MRLTRIYIEGRDIGCGCAGRWDGGVCVGALGFRWRLARGLQLRRRGGRPGTYKERMGLRCSRVDCV